jgi:lysozyme
MLTKRFVAAALTLSLAGTLALIQFEEVRTEAYLDPIGIPTVCAGITKGVHLGDRFTERECAEKLNEETSAVGKGVAACTSAELTQGQYDAVISFAYNVGTQAYCTSTLNRKLNAGDCIGAAAQFKRWDMAGGKHLRGLQRRRAAEAAEFIKGCV